MPQQKRKASAIASAKIAEEAGSSRKRKSDTKEKQNPSAKETNNENVKGDEIEQNVSDGKEVEPSDGSNAQEIHAQEGDNGIITDNKVNEVKSEQGHDQMLVDDEYNGQSPNTDQSKNEQAVNKLSDQNQAQVEMRKELEKKLAPNVLEKGHICFLYRPKINIEEPGSVEETQRMYMLLIPYMVRPSLSEEPISSYFHQVIDNKQVKLDEPIPGKTRVVVFGKKRLPEVEKHTKTWAYVDKAFTNLDDLKDFTSGRTYQTATRGERKLSACRLMGRGVYNIVEHKGHTHLAYVLEFPEEPGDVQKDFNIKHEGSYVISVKNPETTNPQNIGLSDNEKVTYPTYLLDKFGGRRFIPLVSSEFLDYDGAELLFIGAKEDITGELGEAGKELEELADFEIKEIAPLSTERVIYEELHLEKDILPSEPLHGLWK